MEDKQHLDLALEMGMEDALYRIRREYDRTGGNIYLSFSGGKDSTVVGELIKMANLPKEIPFVFSDTGIEFDATKRFVKEYDYPNVVIVKPRKPWAKVLKDNGTPVISKLKSEAIKTYRNAIDDPLSTSRSRQLIGGVAEKGGEVGTIRTRYALANKHFNFLHPDLEYKIANQCCNYMKKLPFTDFEKMSGVDGAFSGVRTAEGGVRAITYNSCVKYKRKHNKEFLLSMPIIDWSNEMVDHFIEKYNVPVSDAYNVYKLDRTGCVGCPFAGDSLYHELKMTREHEPLRYKATMKWLGTAYMDMGHQFDFDEDYMEKFREREVINEGRRKEMLEKFKEFRDERVSHIPKPVSKKDKG